MKTFRDWLENKELGEYKLNESSEISSEIYAKIYKLVKEIVKNDKKYKEEARKLNTWFKKETGKSPVEYKKNPKPERIYLSKLLTHNFKQ